MRTIHRVSWRDARTPYSGALVRAFDAWRNSMNSDFYVENEKMRGSGLFTTAVPYSSNPDKSNDFLTLLEKMQSQRLDEQRCEMPDLHVSWRFSIQMSCASSTVTVCWECGFSRASA
ncbi:hypothetical protein Y032_0042g690 [Ancylostoma ceylanicum]|uniref:Uncharacterized protein n=1 Tax=Ancylostoma ceylanicum TaxID=53326 RepID=A0A016UHK9_9BILA|nr:hypothetical protein Y032_0042g690 [Ancylostoma ceylanicum]